MLPRHLAGRRRDAWQQRDEPADPSIARVNQTLEPGLVERRFGPTTRRCQQQLRKLPAFRSGQRLEIHPDGDQISHIGSRIRGPGPERWAADEQELRNLLDADAPQQAQIGKHLGMQQLRVIHDDHVPLGRRPMHSHDVEQAFHVTAVDGVLRLAEKLGSHGAKADCATVALDDPRRRHGARRKQLPDGRRQRGLSGTRRTSQREERNSRQHCVHQSRQHPVPHGHDKSGGIGGLAHSSRFNFGSGHQEASGSRTCAKVCGFPRHEQQKPMPRMPLPTIRHTTGNVSYSPPCYVRRRIIDSPGVVAAMAGFYTPTSGSAEGAALGTHRQVLDSKGCAFGGGPGAKPLGFAPGRVSGRSPEFTSARSPTASPVAGGSRRPRSPAATDSLDPPRSSGAADRCASPGCGSSPSNCSPRPRASGSAG